MVGKRAKLNPQSLATSRFSKFVKICLETRKILEHPLGAPDPFGSCPSVLLLCTVKQGHAFPAVFLSKRLFSCFCHPIMLPVKMCLAALLQSEVKVTG